MSPEIKICGLTNAEAVEAALAGGACYFGFVFFERSPRHLSPAAAQGLIARLPAGANAVAVTVDASDAELAQIVETAAPRFLQLHGEESPARVAEVSARFARPVIKALAVREAEDVRAAAAYEKVADALLFDAKAPKSLAGALPGGNGLAFDWQLLRAVRPARPWFLSGGLTPENVGEAIRLTGAPRLDVSSGVESQPGIKSPERIVNFLEAVARAELPPATDLAKERG